MLRLQHRRRMLVPDAEDSIRPGGRRYPICDKGENIRKPGSCRLDLGAGQCKVWLESGLTLFAHAHQRVAPESRGFAVHFGFRFFGEIHDLGRDGFGFMVQVRVKCIEKGV